MFSRRALAGIRSLKVPVMPLLWSVRLSSPLASFTSIFRTRRPCFNVSGSIHVAGLSLGVSVVTCNASLSSISTPRAPSAKTELDEQANPAKHQHLGRSRQEADESSVQGNNKLSKVNEQAIKSPGDGKRNLKPWTKSETATLIELRRKGFTSRATAERLCRSVDSVESKWRDLGLSQPYSRWSEQELDKLAQLNESGHSIPRIAAHFPHRSTYSVFRRLERLKAHGQPHAKFASWPEDESEKLRYLRENLRLPWREITKHFPSRTSAAVVGKYRKMGGRWLRSSATRWTDAEDRELLRLVVGESRATSREIKERLPGRSYEAVHHRLSRYRHGRLSILQNDFVNTEGSADNTGYLG